MARFRYAGGDQRPDDYGVLEVGDVLEFSQAPDWGTWEPTGDEPDRQPTPQPAAVQDEPEPPLDTRTRPQPKPAAEPEKTEA